MKAILEFNLPADQSAFNLCHTSGLMYSALWRTAQEVFRPARKHGYEDRAINEILTKLEPHGGHELVFLLEQKFYEILNDNSINLDELEA
jgi:hypothetical protein